MATILRRLTKKESGQALIEYQVLIPGAVLVAIVVAWLIAPRVSDWYCQTVVAFDADACEVMVVADLPPDPNEDPEDEACFILQEEEGSSQCDQSDDCTSLPGINSGSWDSGDPDNPIDVFIIKAGTQYHVYETSITDDGCYFVDMDGPIVTWEKLYGGKDCKDVSHIQNWFIPLCE